MIYSPIVSIDYSVDVEALSLTINPNYIYTKDYVIKCGRFFRFSLVNFRYDCSDVKCNNDVKRLPVGIPRLSVSSFSNLIINMYNSSFGGFPIGKMEDRLYRYSLTPIINCSYRVWDTIDDKGNCYVCRSYRRFLDVIYDFNVECALCSNLFSSLKNIKRLIGG